MKRVRFVSRKSNRRVVLGGAVIRYDRVRVLAGGGLRAMHHYAGHSPFS
jgi:hypothetical protein